MTCAIAHDLPCAHIRLAMQGFDSPQQPQLSGPKSPEWHQSAAENKENALPDQSSTSKQLASPSAPGIACSLPACHAQEDGQSPVLQLDAVVPQTAGDCTQNLLDSHGCLQCHLPDICSMSCTYSACDVRVSLTILTAMLTLMEGESGYTMLVSQEKAAAACSVHCCMLIKPFGYILACS